MFSWKGTKSTQKESKLEWNEIKWKMKPGSQNKAFFIENTSSRKTFRVLGISCVLCMSLWIGCEGNLTHIMTLINRLIGKKNLQGNSAIRKINWTCGLLCVVKTCFATLQSKNRAKKDFYSYRKSNLKQKMERRNNNNKTERNFFPWNQSGRSRAGEKGTSYPPE